MKLLNVIMWVYEVARRKNKERKKGVWASHENKASLEKRTIHKESVSDLLLRNDLVLKLEKEKKIQEKRDFKETLIKENN